ncbi:MAG: hypothetical protein HOW73_22635 [Polyangiaceae bacterium]|nr:hypothetical protein [Polyangiaceae bacterium]
MDLSDDTLETIEALELCLSEIGFEGAWRAFLRAATTLLLPSLPPEASRWAEAADLYDAGRLTVSELEHKRASAWKYLDHAGAGSAPSQTAGLRAVLFRLWPASSRTDWYGEARYFIEFCGHAGVDEATLHALLKQCFAKVNRPIRV